MHHMKAGAEFVLARAIVFAFPVDLVMALKGNGRLGTRPFLDTLDDVDHDVF